MNILRCACSSRGVWLSTSAHLLVEVLIPLRGKQVYYSPANLRVRADSERHPCGESMVSYGVVVSVEPVQNLINFKCSVVVQPTLFSKVLSHRFASCWGRM